MTLSIVFAGTTDFSKVILEYLIKQDYPISLVITKQDSISGRGKKTLPSPVAEYATTHQINCLKPAKITAETIQQIAEVKPDIIIVVAYGHIIPVDLLKTPKYGCWNIHTSLLPLYRGAAPIERCLLDGQAETGISLMQMDSQLDTGDVISQESCSIKSTDNHQTIAQQLQIIGCQLLKTQLQNLTSNIAITSKVQNHKKATYAHKILKQDLWINWQQPAQKIIYQINALYPNARTKIKDINIKILQATLVVNQSNKTAGRVIKFDENGLLISCGENALLIEVLQISGKQPITNTKAFYNGYQHKIAIDDVFSAPVL